MLFSKSYCPYSRALRKMFDENMLVGQYGVFNIDLEKDGNLVHKALKEMSGRQTVPNVYIGGDNVGGDEETEELAKNGQLR